MLRYTMHFHLNSIRYGKRTFIYFGSQPKGAQAKRPTRFYLPAICVTAKGTTCWSLTAIFRRAVFSSCGSGSYLCWIKANGTKCNLSNNSGNAEKGVSDSQYAARMCRNHCLGISETRSATVRSGVLRSAGNIEHNRRILHVSTLDYLFRPDEGRSYCYGKYDYLCENHSGTTDPSGKTNLKGIFLFWTLIDGRERTELYTQYEKVLDALGLQKLSTRIPARSKFSKELQAGINAVYRSTILAPDTAFTADCRLDAFGR